VDNRCARVWARGSFLFRMLLLLTAFFAHAVRGAEEETAVDLHEIFAGAVPVNSGDLLAMQTHLQALSEKVVPATVAVQVGPAQGSGVIISADGYVLTAAHVIMRPHQRATLVLHDGRRVAAETLGVYRTVDAGLMKITTQPRELDRDAWPYVEMGDSQSIKPGQWCLATGHPGGIQSTGEPVVRFGRVLSVNHESAINTDCTLIGGDSGGPLFDMDGNVVGVHSRIGGSLTLNLHVPVEIYRTAWERLEVGDAWGYVPGNRPYLGVQGEVGATGAKVAQVRPGTPAEKAGVEVGDVITKLAGKEVTDFESLKMLVEAHEPGQKVELVLLRGNRRIQVDVIIGRQRD